MCGVGFINADGLRARPPYEAHLRAQRWGVAWERKHFRCFEFHTKSPKDSNCVPYSAQVRAYEVGTHQVDEVTQVFLNLLWRQAPHQVQGAVQLLIALWKNREKHLSIYTNTKSSCERLSSLQMLLAQDTLRT